MNPRPAGGANLLAVMQRWCETVERWGATDAEVADAWPCDDWVPEPDDVLFRALSVDAPPAIVFRWLCQMRVAPYSYDWIDNLGHRSPRELTPGLEHLAVGQRIAAIFKLVGFETDHHVTLHTVHPLFGEVVITYRVEPGPKGTRLAVKLRVRYPSGPIGWLVRPVLPAGDLVMMHKQLNNFAVLAQRTARDRAPVAPGSAG
jgi:hypothetical protein